MSDRLLLIGISVGNICTYVEDILDGNLVDGVAQSGVVASELLVLSLNRNIVVAESLMEDLNLVFVTELRKLELCSATSSVFISVQLFLQQLLYSHIVTKGVGTANTVNDALQ